MRPDLKVRELQAGDFLNLDALHLLVIGFPELLSVCLSLRLKSEHSWNAVLNNYHLYWLIYFLGFSIGWNMTSLALGSFGLLITHHGHF